MYQPGVITISLANIACFQIIARSSGGRSGNKVNSVRVFGTSISSVTAKDIDDDSAFGEEGGKVELNGFGLCIGVISRLCAVSREIVGSGLDTMLIAERGWKCMCSGFREWVACGSKIRDVLELKERSCLFDV